MPYRNSRSYVVFRSLGLGCVASAFAGVVSVLGIYLLGPAQVPSWLYALIWPNATPILSGAILCSLVGTVLLLYPAQISGMESRL